MSIQLYYYIVSITNCVLILLANLTLVNKTVLITTSLYDKLNMKFQIVVTNSSKVLMVGLMVVCNMCWKKCFVVNIVSVN